MSITGLAFLLAYAAGCIVALARHPIYGLLTYVAAFYLHPPSRWWGASLPDLRWSLTAAAVTFLAVLIHKNEQPKIPLLKHKLMKGLMLFVVWIALQSFWALDIQMHMELLILVLKFTLLVTLIYYCVDSEQNLRLFLWAHVLGCFYLGWIVFNEYEGGRFEGFGGPDINEANSGAMQIVTGTMAAAALFLAGKLRQKMALFAVGPFIVNALIATISRSGFLAIGVGGVIFNLFTPAQFRKRVRVLSVVAAVLFVLATNPTYWMRIASIKQLGEEVAGVDTGAGRLVLIEAQWRMFTSNPLGCGHRCTVVLSTSYLDPKYLSGGPGGGARSSHNTFMSLLVEQGIPGALMYIGLLLWIYRSIRTLSVRARAGPADLSACMVPALAAIFAALTLGDVFVDYLKLEVRFWFLAMTMALLSMTAASASTKTTSAAPAQIKATSCLHPSAVRRKG